MPDITCYAPDDVFSSCKELLKNDFLEVFVWIMAMLIFLGNIGVILTRFYERGAQSLFIASLVLSDILMGVYLVIIGYNNFIYKGKYFEHDNGWRLSTSCTVAGVISLLSSQVSLFIITAIATERCSTIMYSMEKFGKHFSNNVTRLIVFLAWSIGLTVTIIPAVYPLYFNEKYLRFYGQNTVCLPLQLADPEKKDLGWEYCLGLFGGLNAILCLYVTICYIAMYITLKKDSTQHTSMRKRENSLLAKRMLGIVSTNLCCWFPVIIFTFISLHGFHRSVTTLHAWTAVCLFPVNSALNPAIYTFFSPSVYRKFKKMLGKTGNDVIDNRAV